MIPINEQLIPSEIKPITDAEFHSIRDLVYDRFGITLSDQKKSLVVGRLQKILRQHNFKTFKQYYDSLIADKTNAAISELANQITTNHTFFFREAEHFDFFKSDILPWMTAEHKKNGNNDLRIWCAAASSGEEPYTLIITLLEFFGADYKNWDCGLLATDVSEKALMAAKRGVYDATRLQGVSPTIINKYFKKTPEGFAVTEQVKKEVTIRRFNLMNKTLPFKKLFDCIWCRNVMIYFDMQTKIELVNRMYQQTVNGGYLLIGHSETLGRDQTRWTYVKPAVYRKME
ncbi:MAG: protein-glutamate O-methyltransferase CheR [Planctomycetaceae bacterium]|jgi:chemotaxis protein methyltransferase CheR|nr:protein-glutamate O-methyltransferase CheR [Planctomycetaceae bacterium]